MDYRCLRKRYMMIIVIIVLILAPAFLDGKFVSPTPITTRPNLGVQTAEPQNTTTVSVTPSAIIQSPVGSQITFGVSISSTPAMNGFSVTLQYDNTVLNAQSLDYSGGIFGQMNPIVGFDCVNGVGTCAALSGPDKVSLQLVLPGIVDYNVSGLLFNVSFKVIGAGLSNIHIVQVLVGDVSTLVPTVSSDGYFSNMECGAAICQPLGVTLTYSAAFTPVISGSPVQFNTTVSNPNGDEIRWYHWEWGDAGGQPSATLTTVPYANHTYSFPGQYLVTLIVNDTYGVTGIATIPIFVARNNPPIIIAPSLTNATLGHTLMFVVTASDSDNDPITLTLMEVSPPLFGVFNFTTSGTNPVTGTFTFAPSLGSGGSQVLVTFAASDPYNSPVTVSTTVQIALAPVTFSGQKLSWTRHLSLSKNNNTQTWTATITNPDYGRFYAQITITATDSTGTIGFIATSPVISIYSGATAKVLLSYTFTTSDVGVTFHFVARIAWGIYPTLLADQGGNVKSGGFTVVA